MDQLTVKELRILCKGLGLSTSGNKAELLERVEQRIPIGDDSDVDSDADAEHCEDSERPGPSCKSIFGRMKRFFLVPFKKKLGSVRWICAYICANRSCAGRSNLLDVCLCGFADWSFRWHSFCHAIVFILFLWIYWNFYTEKLVTPHTKQQ